MFNLKTIIRTTPQKRREYRGQVKEYQRQKRVQALQEAEFNKNLQYANQQQIEEYNRLKSSYDRAFKKQGKELGDTYQKETEKALTKQSEDLANFYKNQEAMKKLEKESQEARAISDKLNFLGFSILDNINASKARAELAQAQARKSSSKSSRSSRAKIATAKQVSYYTNPKTNAQKNLIKALTSKAKVSKASSGKSTLDRILGR